jgi:hypothetical protein
VFAVVRPLKERFVNRRRNIGIALIIFLIIAVLIGFRIGSASAASAAAVPGGVSLGSAYELQTLEKMTPAQQAGVMAGIQATGATWIRIDYTDEYSPGHYDYTLDAMVKQILSSGLSVDAILEVPSWARASSGSANVAITGQYMEQAATHLAGLGVSAIEIINEPNLNDSVATGISIWDYSQLLETIYPVIHAAYPRVTILAGPSGIAVPSPIQVDQTIYLTQMYADGAGGSFDALAIHPYTFPYLPAMQANWNVWTLMPSLHALMAANGDGAKKIWYTEFGAPTAASTRVVTLQVQALGFQQAFTLARSWSWSGPLFAFNWQDSADGAFGLHDSTGAAKPALTAFGRAVTGNTATAGTFSPVSPAPATPTFNSASSATFTMQYPMTFSVQSTGTQPSVTETGALPSGLTFSNGVLWGTPLVGGTFSLTFAATDANSQVATQIFILTVDNPPTITSSNGTTFTIGSPGNVGMSASATPAPIFSETGNLPTGVTFSGGVISGTPVPGTQGVYPLVLSATNGFAPDANQHYSLTVVYRAPTINSITPGNGDVVNPTNVTITGTNFTAVSAVTFGSVPASSYTVVSATTITAVAPPQAVGSHNVTITTPGGTSALVPADAFSYPPDVPAITALSPAGGAVSGGTTVVITGTEFSGASAVGFGSIAATSFAVVNPTTIMAVAPPEAAGVHTVVVTTPGGVSAGGTAAQYSYAPPAVTGLSPSSGPTSGATTVTITGSGFGAATSVKFGNVAATSFNVVNANTIAAVAPAQAAGTHSVTVIIPGGVSATGPACQYTYNLPAVTSVRPATGSKAGGTSVTIIGSGFTGTTAVKFGNVAAARFNIVNSTTIAAITPAQAAGTHSVIVTTPWGASPAVAAGQYSYR